MINDSEQKAIENIEKELNKKYEIVPLYKDFSINSPMNIVQKHYNDTDIKIILNLISKLQKENEELKEKEKNLLLQLKDSEKELLEISQKLQKLQKELDNRIPKKDVEEILKKHKKAMKLAREQISEKIIIADSDSLNCGRKEAHNLIISDLIDLLKRSK